MSLPEVLLWQRLKGAPQGVRFRKQHPIGAYRADFSCAAARLIIEVDGIAHDMGDRPSRDEVRTAELERAGYRAGYKVFRVPAADILRAADEAAGAIVAFAQSSPERGGGSAKPRRRGGSAAAAPLSRPLHHSPAASGPPPRAGEDHHA
jgi:very-short-patch-repair endonuclease